MKNMIKKLVSDDNLNLKVRFVHNWIEAWLHKHAMNGVSQCKTGWMLTLGFTTRPGDKWWQKAFYLAFYRTLKPVVMLCPNAFSRVVSDPEKQRTMIKFIVLHECGHQYHAHIERAYKNGDFAGGIILNEKYEIEADNYALDNMLPNERVGISSMLRSAMTHFSILGSMGAHERLENLAAREREVTGEDPVSVSADDAGYRLISPIFNNIAAICGSKL